jgi:hypothetical protein
MLTFTATELTGKQTTDERVRYLVRRRRATPSGEAALPMTSGVRHVVSLDDG